MSDLGAGNHCPATLGQETCQNQCDCSCPGRRRCTVTIALHTILATEAQNRPNTNSTIQSSPQLVATSATPPRAAHSPQAHQLHPVVARVQQLPSPSHARVSPIGAALVAGDKDKLLSPFHRQPVARLGVHVAPHASVTLSRAGGDVTGQQRLPRRFGKPGEGAAGCLLPPSPAFTWTRGASE